MRSYEVKDESIKNNEEVGGTRKNYEFMRRAHEVWEEGTSRFEEKAVIQARKQSNLPNSDTYVHIMRGSTSKPSPNYLKLALHQLQVDVSHTGVQTKKHLWYNATSNWCNMKVMSRDKIVPLPGVSTCRPTSLECLQHIHFSLRQSTTYPSMTSKSRSLSYFEHSSNWNFHYIQFFKKVYTITIRMKNTNLS